METDADKKDESTSHSLDAPPQACGAECDCVTKDGGNKKLKVVVCVVVLLAAGGILLFKALGPRAAPSVCTTGFVNPFTMSGSSGLKKNAVPAAPQGSMIPSIDTLNILAARLDTVFLMIPAKNAPMPTEATVSVDSVQQTLKSKGLNTGVFTLQIDSPDYPDMAAKVRTPGVAVLSRGQGIGFVSGSVSESTVMQAYVTSTRSGGCCPSGGSDPGKECK